MIDSGKNEGDKTLRQKAEELYKQKSSEGGSNLLDVENLKLIHELEVHQIELELQNEELEAAKLHALNNAEKYTDLYDFAPTGYFTLSKEKTISELNHAGAKMLGQERSYLKNKLFGLFVSEKSRPDYNRFIENMFASDQKESCEIKLLTNGQSHLILSGTANPTKDQYILNAVDITEKVVAEQKLKESEELHRITLENINDPVFITKDDGTFTFICPNIERTLGYTTDEIVGMGKISNLLGENLFDLNNLNPNKKIENIEHTLKDKNGKIHFFLVSVKRVSIQGGTILYVFHDITERKHLQDELKQNKERFEGLVHLLPEAVFEIDLNLNLTYVNQRALEMCGYTREDIADGLNAMEIIAPEERQKAKNVFALRLKGEDPGIMEYTALRKDGSTFPILFHANSIIGDGKLLGARGIIVDISELKKVEQDLLKSEEKFKNIFYNSVVGKSITSLDGHIQVNKAFSQIVGYSEEELNQMQWQAFTHPDDIEKNKEVVKSILAGKTNTALWEKRYIHIDGHIVWVYISTTLQRDIEGKPQFFITSVVDITEQKQAEKELLRGKELLTQTGRMAKVGGWELDVLTMETYFTEETFRIYELPFGSVPSVEEAIKFYAPEAQPIIKKAVSDAIEKNIPYDIEVPFITAKGKNIWVRTNCQTELKDGKVIRLFGTIQDITERRLAEEELRSSQQILEGIFNTVNVRIFWKDKNLNYLGCNQAFANDAGFSNPKEIIGKDDFLMGWCDQAEMYRKDDLEVIKSGVSKINIEEPQTTQEGKTITLLTNKVPLKNSAGKVDGILGTYIDITERKMSENVLRESEMRFRSTFDQSPVGSVIVGLDKRFTRCNKSFCDFLGYSEKEIVGRCIDEVSHPEDVEIGMKELQQLVQGTIESTRLQKRYIRKDGEIVWGEVSIHLLHDADKKPLYFLPIIRDITLQKLAQQELLKAKEKAEESEKKYREIYNNLPVGIFRSTLSGIILSANPAFLDIYGIHSLEEAQTTEAQDFYTTKNDREKIIGELKAKHVVNDFVTKEKKKDGSEIWVETNYSAVKNEKGEIEYIDGILEDITARVEAEIALRSEQNRLRTLLDNLPDAIYVKDEFARKLIANPIDVKNIGANSESEILGKDDLELYPGEIGLKFYKQDMKVLQSGNPLINYEEYFFKDGVQKWLLTTKIPLFDDEKKIVGLVGVGRDITARKQIEKDLIAAKERAEESDRLKSAFLANMSHEIRTPMNGILGFADLLKEPQLTGEEQQVYVNIIQKSGIRMLNTINNIIDISKIESGQMDVTLSEFSVQELLENTYTFFKLEADKKGVRLNYNNKLSSDKDIIKADREKLDSVLTNLVKNALKFCSKGEIEFACSENKNGLEFHVKDTGKGIPANRQKAIFNRFVQADIEDREAKQGSGLGLTISKSYVEMMGGKIWVESQLNKGTTFYFTLPKQTSRLKKEYKDSDKFVNDVQNEVRSLKILLAEDDDISEMLTFLIIEKFSNEILKARNGVEAVEICRENPDIDIILMDIRMPKMDGYQAAREIRKFNKDVIIIAQTAFGLSGDREKAIHAGCNDYISKPIKKEKLIGLIFKYL